ncbi:MAG: SAP domain-containing protein [Geobacter sp.]|nr:SAP domain-containing protein [Geobacter sp.]
MKIEKIKEIAKQKGVVTGKMKKSEIVRAIQQLEGNTTCFDTGQAAECGQDKCLWREDCK